MKDTQSAINPVKIRVLCIDDDPLDIRLLRLAIDSEEDLAFVKGLSTADSMLEVLAQDDCPDVVLIDLSMPGRDPYLAIQDGSRLFPHCKFIVYSGFCDDKLEQRALNAGAVEFVTKGCSLEDLFAAIRRAAPRAEKRETLKLERGEVGNV